jgi:hypothetical protein
MDVLPVWAWVLIGLATLLLVIFIIRLIILKSRNPAATIGDLIGDLIEGVIDVFTK